MEATPYLIPPRNADTMEADKENTLLQDSPALPFPVVQGRHFIFGSKRDSVRQAPPLRDLCNGTGEAAARPADTDSCAALWAGEYPAPPQVASPTQQQPLFACVYGQSPGQTPMPGSTRRVIRELPGAPAKGGGAPEDCLATPAPSAIDPPLCVRSCPKRGHDRLLRLPAAGKGCHRVRARRALDLHSSASLSGQERGFAHAFRRLRARPAVADDEAAAAGKPAPALLLRKRLVPLDEEGGNDGEDCSKAPRKMRAREAGWQAAREGIAGLHLSDDM